MSRPDSLESIKKRYNQTINIDGDIGGVLRCWVIGFKDKTLVCMWVEFPNHDGNLTPLELTIEPYSSIEQLCIKAAGNIKIWNINMPDNWRKLKLF